MIATRKSSGNMTILMSLTFALVVALCVIGLNANNLFFNRTRGQHDADALAVTLANKLNEGDRIGQVNELQNRCRELVFVSRDQYEACVEQEPLLAPLANQLLEEARADYQMVEAERKNQMATIVSEAHDFGLMKRMLPVRRIELGKITSVESSVHNDGVIAELSEYDRRQGYVEARSGLFRAERDIKLPLDSDLRFRFSSLPAYIKGTSSPARNTNEDVFQRYAVVYERGTLPAALRELPSAVQIVCSQDNGIELKSTAITFGATPEGL